MKIFFGVLIAIVLILLICCFIFYKLWRKNKSLVKDLSAYNKELRYRLDFERNKKEIFEEVFDKKEDDKKKMAGCDDKEAYHKIMEDFRE